jgi:hypothetical protein
VRQEQFGMSILTPFDSFNISKEIQKLKTENSEKN